MRGFFYCYYDEPNVCIRLNESYRTRSSVGCGFDRSPSRDAVDRFLPDPKHVVDKVFDKETAMRVTCDALAVAKPVWMLGDSAYDTLDWHDFLLAAGVVSVARHNPRDTDDPKDVEYRIEDRIDEHSEDVQLKQSTLDEAYNCRTGVEQTNEPVKDCGLGRTYA